MLPVQAPDGRARNEQAQAEQGSLVSRFNAVLAFLTPPPSTLDSVFPSIANFTHSLSIDGEEGKALKIFLSLFRRLREKAQRTTKIASPGIS